MPYLCQNAQASFSSILALRLMAVVIAASYWCSRCCHPFVPYLATLMYSSKTVHQRVMRVRRSSSSSVKLRNSLLQTYGLQIVLILTLVSIEYDALCGIVFISCQFETWPIWSRAWLTHGTDCRRVSLMMRRRMAEETQGLREEKGRHSEHCCTL